MFENMTIKERMDKLDLHETMDLVRRMDLQPQTKFMNEFQSIVHDFVYDNMGNDDCTYYMEYNLDYLIKEIDMGLLWELFDDFESFNDLVDGRYIGEFDVYHTYLVFEDSCTNAEYIKCSTNDICEVAFEEVYNDLLGEHDLFGAYENETWERLGEYIDEIIVCRLEEWCDSVGNYLLENI